MTEAEVIDSVKHPLIVSARELTTRPGRERAGRCLADGARLVTNILDAGDPVEALLVPRGRNDEPAQQDLRAAATRAGVAVHEVKPGVLRHVLAGAAPPEALAVCPLPQVRSVAAPAARLAVVCAGVADPGNLGSIVRTAVGLGPAAVVLTGDEDPGSRRVLDASRGAALRAELCRFAGAAAGVRALQAAGWWVVGADGRADLAIDRAVASAGDRAARPVALVVGNETDGLAPAVAAACDQRAVIPLDGTVESLNVAVAAGIGLWVLSHAGVGSA